MAADIRSSLPDAADIVILADNDDAPGASFDNICNQIRTAPKTRGWAVPTAPATKERGNPSVSIWMFPSAGQPGCLETLLWEAIRNQRGHQANVACVEAACRCSGADKWTQSRLDKAKVRNFLSLVCENNPSVSFNNLWRDFPHLIPVMQTAFNSVADFLRSI
jgi:hypothetical protein